LAVVAGCVARRSTCRSASTASGEQRRNAPATASKNGRLITVRPLRTIPVVILTTSRAEEDILKAYKLHANCYITKPVDFVPFIRVVKIIETF